MADQSQSSRSRDRPPRSDAYSNRTSPAPSDHRHSKKKTSSSSRNVSTHSGETPRRTSPHVARSDAPPLPDEPPPVEAKTSESAPPLPIEPPPAQYDAAPGTAKDDGWQAMWDEPSQRYYFYNRFTKATQWDNPRVPDASASASIDTLGPPPGLSTAQDGAGIHPAVVGGYNPSIHGDYETWLAQNPVAVQNAEDVEREGETTDATGAEYSATARFNRFTGRFQNEKLAPENFNDENKSRRQMDAYFDVDGSTNHDGRSLKAERAGKKLTKSEVKAFKEKRREKKEQKRRAWLKD